MFMWCKCLILMALTSYDAVGQRVLLPISTISMNAVVYLMVCPVLFSFKITAQCDFHLSLLLGMLQPSHPWVRLAFNFSSMDIPYPMSVVPHPLLSVFDRIEVGQDESIICMNNMHLCRFSLYWRRHRTKYYWTRYRTSKLSWKDDHWFRQFNSCWYDKKYYSESKQWFVFVFRHRCDSYTLKKIGFFPNPSKKVL